MQKIEPDGTLSSSFHEARIILIPKSNILKERKTTDQHLIENSCKNPQQNISKSNPAIYKHKETQSIGVYNVNARVVQKYINVTHHITV